MVEDKNQLTKDDLVLLMESYRNMIVMHQTVLDQSNKAIDQLNNIATKQDNLFSKTGLICGSLDSIKEKTKEGNGKIKEGNDKLDKLSTTLNDHEKKSIEEHGKMTNKIYLGWIGMGTIILGLIGLGYTMSSLIQHYTK